jgi:hypothetical protein
MKPICSGVPGYLCGQEVVFECDGLWYCAEHDPRKAEANRQQALRDEADRQRALRCTARAIELMKILISEAASRKSTLAYLQDLALEILRLQKDAKELTDVLWEQTDV